MGKPKNAYERSASRERDLSQAALEAACRGESAESQRLYGAAQLERLKRRIME